MALTPGLGRERQRPLHDVCAVVPALLGNTGMLLWFPVLRPRTGCGTFVIDVRGCRADREIPSWTFNWVRFGGVR